MSDFDPVPELKKLVEMGWRSADEWQALCHKAVRLTADLNRKLRFWRSFGAYLLGIAIGEAICLLVTQ